WGVGPTVPPRPTAMPPPAAPWRPADIEQRDGRILRQGNQNPEVRVLRYVTEGSFDTYMWQTLERKAAFIAQVTRGDLPDRDVDDIGDQALSFAEVKALATGDPLVLEKAAVDADVARLTRLERAHHDDQHRLRRTYDTATHRAEKAEHRIADLEAVVGRITDTRGDRFAMTIDGRSHTKRVDAGEHLQRLLSEQLRRTAPETSGPTVEIASLGGLTVIAQAITTIEDEVRVALPDAHVEVSFLSNDLTRDDPANLITRIERHLHRLPDTIADLGREASDARAEAQRAEVRIGAPWQRADELTDLRNRQKEIEEQLAATTETAHATKEEAAGEPQPQRPSPTTAVPAAAPGRTLDDMAAAERMTARLDAIQYRAAMGRDGIGL
ncbi:MAG TPA: hypothetical protein PKE05_02120, partial [Microthrixaceae bacterium]|nr:hypothetical protein [Microthrixaceae bacterium]